MNNVMCFERIEETARKRPLQFFALKFHHHRVNCRDGYLGNFRQGCKLFAKRAAEVRSRGLNYLLISGAIGSDIVSTFGAKKAASPVLRTAVVFRALASLE